MAQQNAKSKEIPSYNIPHSFISHSLDMVQAFQQCGDEEKASEIYNQLLNNYDEYQQWETAKRKQKQRIKQ